MKSLLNVVSVIIILCSAFAGAFAQNSVLRSGNWYQVSVQQHGVYKISRDQLRNIGVDPSKIDPRNIKMYGYGNGMLPQANSTARFEDLPEIAIHVEGEADGKFDNQDYILFFAAGPDKIAFNSTKEVFLYEKNLYSDRSFYFITIGSDAGKRVSTVENVPGVFPVINSFNDFAFHENDQYNELHSGREWYGEKFGLTNTRTFTFNMSGVVSGSAIKIISDVVGQATVSSPFRLSLNNVFIGEQKPAIIFSGRYAIKGEHKRDTFTVVAEDVNTLNRANQELKYDFVKGVSTAAGYLDYAIINAIRELAIYNNQTSFLSKASVANPFSTFEIKSVTQGTRVWDVTDPFEIKEQTISINGTVASFSTNTSQLKTFIAFNNNVPSPDFVSKVDNQNLRGASTPALIIISHPKFISEAERLAAHRENQGWTTLVVTPQQIYNEFSSGRQDMSAIRDFIRHVKLKSPSTLKSVLLVGKCSYDYKDRITNNTNFVPTYQSRNSLAPLQTFSSDDYFAFLDNNEGNWGEDPTEDHTLDIGLGRLPVTTPDQARQVVDKLIHYDITKNLLGSWRKKIVFVADDGNSEDGFTTIHQFQADQLAIGIEQDQPGFNTQKLFMGSYQKVSQPNGELVRKMTEDITRAFEEGALIINYTGHGSEKLWADERVFSDQNIIALKNKRHPLLVTATCEFGRHDDPLQMSSAELSMTLDNAGAIGLVTTTRPVNANTNLELNRAFYDALFIRENGKYISLGEVFRRTKNNSTIGTANRNFSLLGDPSMTLALPQPNIKVTHLKTDRGSDTLKALSEVIVKGEIQNEAGERMTAFNGSLEATLFDKQTRFTTIGRNNPAFTYQQWTNALFRGKASVKDGYFEMIFILPKNIEYQVGFGKLSLYASDSANFVDATGFANQFKIGGSESSVGIDNTPPSIEAFMGDTTFFNGGSVSPDTYIVAKLRDDSGINISNYGIGNSITAVLDNDAQAFILNDYYIANTDDFTSGLVQYPVKGLSPGKHTLTVKAWDVYNNPAQTTINFVVTNGEGLVIETFSNYPNPFTENTTLFFTHNRSGDDLEAQLFIYNLAGEIFQKNELTIPESAYRVDLMELSKNGSENKLPAGLYLARLIVRSLTNGSKNEQVTKLIVLN